MPVSSGSVLFPMTGSSVGLDTVAVLLIGPMGRSEAMFTSTVRVSFAPVGIVVGFAPPRTHVSTCPAAVQPQPPAVDVTES